MICSRCGTQISDFYVNITTTFKVVRLTEEGCSVPFSNISEPSQEYLCSECFNEYCDCLDSLNKSNNGMLIANMVEVVDEVQYGNGLPDLNIQYNNEECNCNESNIGNVTPSLAEMVEYVD